MLKVSVELEDIVGEKVELGVKVEGDVELGEMAVAGLVGPLVCS